MMKKVFFLLSMCAAVMTANAQSNDYKYRAHEGSLSTEVQFNPFDQNGNTFSLDGLKLRYFMTDQDALRFKLGFSATSNTNRSTLNKDDSNYDDKKGAYSRETYGNVNIDFGYEHHFMTSGRIDLYTGLQLGVERDFASAKEKDGDYTYKITGRTSADDDDNPKVAAWGVNLAGFTGIDFYVYRGLYIGAELGVRLSHAWVSDYTIKRKNSSYGNSEEDKREFSVKSHTTNLKTYIDPALRLGWTF